jgi:hypothetical protein
MREYHEILISQVSSSLSGLTGQSRTCGKWIPRSSRGMTDFTAGEKPGRSAPGLRWAEPALHVSAFYFCEGAMSGPSRSAPCFEGDDFDGEDG